MFMIICDIILEPDPQEMLISWTREVTDPLFKGGTERGIQNQAFTVCVSAYQQIKNKNAGRK